MRIGTRSAAEDTAAIAVPNEVTCGRCISPCRRLSFRFSADRLTATRLSGATEQGSPANQHGRTLHGSTIAADQSYAYTGNTVYVSRHLARLVDLALL
jgi:hypothetical protein